MEASSQSKGEGYQPEERYGHSTVRVGDYLYMWCGNFENWPEAHTSEEKTRLSSCIEIFNLNTHKWEQKLTTGNPPLAVRFYASAAIGENIFYFGGSCGCNYGSCYQNSLYCLDVSTLHWSELSPNTVTEGCRPSMKGFCGMVPVLLNGDHYLVVVGGFGPSLNNTPHQPKALYSEEGLSLLNNEIHYYHLATGQWTSPQVIGERVPPCNGFTLTSVGDNCAILYGGNTVDVSSNYAVYVMTFRKDSVVSKVIPPPVLNMSSWPKGRENHASVFIDSELGPHLLVVGGYPSPNDCWLFDINKAIWKELVLPGDITGRNGHSLSVIPTANSWIVIVFGGWLDSSRVSDTTAIELTNNGEDTWYTAWYSISPN